MAEYAEALNQDANGLKTSARHDASLGTWVHDQKTVADATRISSAPVTGVKTVTGVPAELFAGASRKPGRCRLTVCNCDPAIRIRIGPATVSDTTGFGVEPQAAVALELNPAADVPIYAVSEAGNVQVEVFEA